jgi:hypothetical protein
MIIIELPLLWLYEFKLYILLSTVKTTVRFFFLNITKVITTVKSRITDSLQQSPRMEASGSIRGLVALVWGDRTRCSFESWKWGKYHFLPAQWLDTFKDTNQKEAKPPTKKTLGVVMVEGNIGEGNRKIDRQGGLEGWAMETPICAESKN